MSLKISLFYYKTDPLLPQRDGVNLAHENIRDLLSNLPLNSGLEVSFHDFKALLESDYYALNQLKDCDCVISNVGPHAHYYYFLRQKLGLKYKIIRDARTSLWSSYLLQEYLIAPYLRSSDILLVASNFTKYLYESLFPHLQEHTVEICYPLFKGFPTILPSNATNYSKKSMTTIGYVGRLSDDKNFPDLVSLLINLNKSGSGKFKLLACGNVHSPSCNIAVIKNKIIKELGDESLFEYLPARSNKHIWDVYQQFDILVFPSTSSLETLGRVLIEASYAHIPILSAAHAAAPELINESSLCDINYFYDHIYDTHFDHSLGKIDLSAFLEKIIHKDYEHTQCHLKYSSHSSKFLDLLKHHSIESSRYLENSIHQKQIDFAKSICLSMPKIQDIYTNQCAIELMSQWFLDLQNTNTATWQTNTKNLLRISRYPERTQRYIDKCKVTCGDFTNVGGIDIELCHLLKFYPCFSLKPPTQF